MYTNSIPSLGKRLLTLIQMSEEIKNASRIVPRAMTFSIFVNGVLGFAMLISILFCLGNVDDVLNPDNPFPFMVIFLNGVQSLAGATTMAAVITVLTICATISVVASASRMTWSFARDRGVPGWSYISKVSSPSTVNGSCL